MSAPPSSISVAILTPPSVATGTAWTKTAEAVLPGVNGAYAGMACGDFWNENVDYVALATSVSVRTQNSSEFRSLLGDNEFIHEDMRHHFEGFPPNAHPMAILSAMINAASCYNPDIATMESPETFQSAAAAV